MGLRGLITLDVNSDVKKCLNLQVSSTSILVTSTVMPNMHNSGLKGNFQIAIFTPLVYLDYAATNGTNISPPPYSFPTSVLSLFSPSQVSAGVLASAIFLCVLPFFWPLLSFSAILSFSCLFFIQSKSPKI